MTIGRIRLPGGRTRRAAVFCALSLSLVGRAGVAATPPTITLNPNSGTPGSVVAIRGSGFCASTSCSPITVLFAGNETAAGIPVRSDGTFRDTFRVPGGGVVGQQNVTATQTTADGNELRAFTQFDLVFGKGEEAEVQAEINDLVARPSESVLAEGPPRGVPFASLVAETPDAPGSDGSGGTESALRAAARDAGERWPYILTGGVLLGGLAALLVRRLRRPRGSHAA